MSRILRRPMFRGGQVSSYGNGIATGLANGGMPNKRGFVDGPGGYAGVLDIREQISEDIPEKKGLSTGDYLRIASAGMDILGAPSEGGGIKGLLASASRPLSKLGTDLGSSMDQRSSDREKKIATYTGIQADYDVGMKKAQSVGEFKEQQIDSYWDPQIAEAIEKADKESVKILKEKKAKDKYRVIVLGEDISDKMAILRNQAATDQANQDARTQIASTKNPTTLVNWEETDVGYVAAKNAIRDQYLKEASEFLEIKKVPVIGTDKTDKKAEGGPVGMMSEDVNLMEATPAGMTDINIQETETMQPEEPQAEQLSYDELRARLPQEIGDDIVELLANSYEALADFAEISTQSDIDLFNSKYGVQLVLPQEA